MHDFRSNKHEPGAIVRTHGMAPRFTTVDAWTDEAGRRWVRTHDPRPVPPNMARLPPVTPIVGDTILYSYSGGPLTNDDAARRYVAGDRIFYECFEVV